MAEPWALAKSGGTYDRRNVVWFHVACATCSVCQRTSPVDDSPPGQTMSPPRRVQGGLRFSLEVKTPGSAGATERPATPRHLTQTSRSKIESTGLGSWDSRYSPRLPNWRSRRSSSAFISAEEGLIISTAAGRLHIGRDRNGNLISAKGGKSQQYRGPQESVMILLSPAKSSE